MMPIKFLRLLIALTLAFAIPMQGMASVTAGVCMAIGHHDAGHDSDHSAPHEDDSSSHCAPCVACCAAASIAPALQVFVPQESPPAAFSVLPFLPAGFLPEKLDRPPLAL
ncbi:MAG TPA: hypothetical protein VFZ84_13185 [Burkholderiales bacterium]